jgi:hypothetical protein
MGKYCKAYTVKNFRQFDGWTENGSNARPEKEVVDGTEVTTPRVITDDDFLYLQENYTVTDGIFIDENIIFDAVTPEWTEFCKSTLEFEAPVYESAGNNGEQPVAAGAAAAQS